MLEGDGCGLRDLYRSSSFGVFLIKPELRYAAILRERVLISVTSLAQDAAILRQSDCVLFQSRCTTSEPPIRPVDN